MKLPFSKEQFLNVFGRYNSDLWPLQVFTLGILLFSLARLSWYVYLIPLLWSLVGVSAAMTLSITEAFVIGIAGVITLVAFMAKTKACVQVTASGD